MKERFLLFRHIRNDKMQKLKALKVLENMVTDAFKDSEVKIVLFGSRARRDYVNTSDIDIGILPKGICMPMKGLTVIRQNHASERLYMSVS